ncbi:hypothetical protein ACWJJH_19790 [Endozoicomonadaceae bacterium StTr2]
MPWTYMLGIALMLWVCWDLITGSAWLHREYHRSSEPFGYWCTLLLWLGVAVSCFYW